MHDDAPTDVVANNVKNTGGYRLVPLSTKAFPKVEQEVTKKSKSLVFRLYR